MQVQFLCSTRQLNTNSENGEGFWYDIFSLTNNPDALNAIIDSDLKRIKIGSNKFFDEFQNKLYFYSVPIKYTYRQQAKNEAERYHTYLKRLMIAMWLVKDNSCNVPFFLCTFPDDAVFEITTNTFYSNCRGEYTPVEFTTEELFEASRFADLIDEFSTGTEHEQRPDFQNDQINRGAINFAFYNSFARADRAHLFLQLARSTSFLPLKISYYVLLVECILSPDERSENSRNVANRLSFYLGGSPEEKQEIFKEFKKAYNTRNKFFHGQPLITDTDESSYLISQAKWLDTTIRILLRKVLVEDAEKFRLNDTEYKAWLNSLLSDNSGIITQYVT